MTKEGTSDNSAQSPPRVALITGSGRKRVGYVIARRLARRGYCIALHYHSSREEAESTRDEIRAVGSRCEAFRADVSSEAEVDRLLDQVRDQFGRLDVLVTTSSIWETTPLEEITAEHLRQNFDVNTLGTFLCARRAGLMMAGQSEGGSIITIGDWAIERPYLDHAPYFVSKGSIPTLTRVLAVELASRNPAVRVNCIHPGPVMFPPGSSADEQQDMIDSTLVKDGDCPEMVASAVEFLIENRFVTGVCLPVDGGRTIFASDEAIRKRST